MRERVVLQTGVVQDPALDAVVRAQVPEVDEGGAPHVGPAAAPEAGEARLLQHLAATQHLVSPRSSSPPWRSPGRVPGPLDPGRLAQHPPPPLHLDLGLDEVGGRGHELPDAPGQHPRHDLLPDGEPVLVILGQLVPDLLVSGHAET